MERRNEASIYWNRPYGWRAGTRYIEPDASAVDVIRYKQEALGNALDVPDFLLAELAHKQVSAREIVWICRTKEHAKCYGGRDIGQPYKEDFGPHTLILATDQEPETGYLLLSDASALVSFARENFAFAIIPVAVFEHRWRAMTNISDANPVATSFIIIFAVMEPFKHAFSPFDDILFDRNAKKWALT